MLAGTMKSLKTDFYFICLLHVGSLISPSAPLNIPKQGSGNVAVAGDLCSGFEYLFSPITDLDSLFHVPWVKGIRLKLWMNAHSAWQFDITVFCSL